MLKTLVPATVMVVVVLLLKMVVPVNYASKASCILYIAVISIIGAIVYLVIAYKQGLLDKVFGREYLNKIIKKITFGKINLKAG